MLAGTDVSRFGVMTRFALSHEFDIGIQLALDRYEEASHYGGGIDLKYDLPIETSGAPIHIALDMGVGDVIKAAATVVSLVLIWRLRRHSMYTASIALGVLCAWLLFINVWNICHII